jgi:hypothetical protein
MCNFLIISILMAKNKKVKKLKIFEIEFCCDDFLI